MSKEIWKPVPGYEDLYKISNQGKVKSLKRKDKNYIMSHSLRMGRPSVILSRDGSFKHHRVHRLLALTFIPNPKNKPFVDHIDGNPTNYCLTNLRWVTAGENARYARDSKLWREVFDIIEKTQDDETNLLRRLTEEFSLKRPCRLASASKFKDRPPVKRDYKSQKTEHLKIPQNSN